MKITAAGREELVLSGDVDQKAPVIAVNLDVDNSASALAQYALARLSRDKLESDEHYPECFGREIGATVARYCGGLRGEADEKFAAFLQLMLKQPLANFDRNRAWNDYCQGQYRLGLMIILQFFAREAAATNALATRRSADNFEKTVLVNMLGINRGIWKNALDVASQVARCLETDTTLTPKILTIGISGYHEERILAKLASDIFLLKTGYDGLQLASSPWAFQGVLAGMHEEFNKNAGRADIRLVNAAGCSGIAQNIFSPPLFRHKGYRSFVNKAWLWSQLDASDTPATVRAWIKAFFDADAGAKRRMLSPDSLAVRAWLTLKGEPVNYQQTEFEALLSYLATKSDKLLSEAPVQLLAPASPDPDDVFENLIRGNRPVLISGSIHDLLLEEFWTNRNTTFTCLLSKPDFADWYNEANVGKNLIKYSDRLKSVPHIQTLVFELFRHILRSVVQIAGSEDDRLRKAMFAYIATILAPTHRENWNTEETDTRWSFAGRESAIAALLLDEMEIEDITPTEARSGETVRHFKRRV